ncbi:hypothetical protein [Mycobacteroides abscessus]|uniref:hypothetical protein n=1 Tax=Mycobacteroides abscessus TaxID=36809 RepID=UPI0009CD494D|nr:hypothetical protein [Mycobacteroides abscessus]SKT81482.1 Uncharacterised protein [Mycobacteroides abscessus subsp. massiliense]SKT98695.1 Uncharacterised protein [Mycobacteroides abscessus subsp. massiliense]
MTEHSESKMKQHPVAVFDGKGHVWMWLSDGWRFIDQDAQLSEDCYPDLPQRYGPFSEIAEGAANFLRQSSLFSVPVLRPAALDHYAWWLRDWIMDGHRPNAYFDSPFHASQWRIADEVDRFIVPCNHGAGSVNIIVPIGVEHYVFGDLGHNQLYAHDGPEQLGGLIPVYSDPVFLELLDMDEFLDQLSVHRGGRWKQENASV